VEATGAVCRAGWPKRQSSTRRHLVGSPGAHQRRETLQESWSRSGSSKASKQRRRLRIGQPRATRDPLAMQQGPWEGIFWPPSPLAVHPVLRATQSGRPRCERGRASRARERGCAAFPGLAKTPVSRFPVSRFIPPPDVSVGVSWLAGGRKEGRAEPRAACAVSAGGRDHSSSLSPPFGVYFAGGGRRRIVGGVVGQDERAIGSRPCGKPMGRRLWSVQRALGQADLDAGYRRGTIMWRSTAAAFPRLAACGRTRCCRSRGAALQVLKPTHTLMQPCVWRMLLRRTALRCAVMRCTGSAAAVANPRRRLSDRTEHCARRATEVRGLASLLTSGQPGSAQAEVRNTKISEYMACKRLWSASAR
jgi:hypothetical protein